MVGSELRHPLPNVMQQIKQEWGTQEDGIRASADWNLIRKETI
jgi:hypothetical protein